MLKTKPKFFPTSSVIPIKDINGDIVLTTSGTYLKVIETPAINLKLRSNEEQYQLLEIWRDLVFSLGYPCQFYIKIRNLYIEDFLSNLKTICDKEKSPLLKAALADHISHIKYTVQEKNILERKFYIVIAHKPFSLLSSFEKAKRDFFPKKENGEKPDISFIKDELSSREQGIMDNLARMGIVAKTLSYEELINLYYFIFNSPLASLRDRLSDVLADDNFLDLIKPEYIFEGSDYLQVGGAFYRSLFARSFRRRVPRAFLQRIIDTNQDIDLSIHLEPVPQDYAQQTLSKNIARMQSTKDRQLTKGIKDSVLKKTIEDAEELSDRIAVEEDRILDLSMYVNVIAKSLESLNKKTSLLSSTMKSMGISPLTAKLNMLDAFMSVAPLRENRLRKYRNMDTAALRGFFPLSSSDISQGKGIYMGINRHNNSIVIIDIFSGNNYAVLILGPPGTGKSYLVKNIIERYFFLEVDSIISDPQGEYTKLVKALNGENIFIGPGSQSSINVFDLVISADESKFDVISLKAQDVVAFLSLLIGGITQRQKDIIENHTYKLYKSKRAPLLSDLYRSLKEEDLIADILPSLEKYCYGTYSGLFSKPTNINLMGRVINFDLSKMEEALKPAVTLLIKNLAVNLAKTELKKRIVVFDEVNRLLVSEEASRQLEDFSRTVRKLWIAPIFVDHEIGKLLGSEYGSVIINNCEWKFLFKQEPTHIEKIGKVFMLSEEENLRLLNLSRGETLFFHGLEHILFKVDSSKFEHRLITTDPEDLKEEIKERGEVK